MQTGLIVDFRTREVLRNQLEEDSYPLLYSQHIKNGRVVWPLGKEGEVIKQTAGLFFRKTVIFSWLSVLPLKRKREDCNVAYI